MHHTNQHLEGQRFSSFKEFYPYYLSEHSNQTCRALHYLGSVLVIICLVISIVTAQYTWLWCLPVIGYGFAWIGHFFFEHNRPATFKYPIYSFMGDWVMLKDACLGRIK